MPCTEVWGFLTKNSLGVLHSGQSSPMPPEPRGEYSLILFHCENLTGFLDVKSKEVWGLPKTTDTQSFSLSFLRVSFSQVHTQPPAIFEITI